MPKRKLIIDIHKFADIDEAELPIGLKGKLTYTETYTDEILNENLYGIERVREEMQSNSIVFSEEQETFFVALEKELNENDCAYFRIINP